MAYISALLIAQLYPARIETKIIFSMLYLIFGFIAVSLSYYFVLTFYEIHGANALSEPENSLIILSLSILITPLFILLIRFIKKGKIIRSANYTILLWFSSFWLVSLFWMRFISTWKRTYFAHSPLLACYWLFSWLLSCSIVSLRNVDCLTKSTDCKNKWITRIVTTKKQSILLSALNAHSWQTWLRANLARSTDPLSLPSFSISIQCSLKSRNGGMSYD